MSQINLPWLVIGDFNTIYSSMEHKGDALHYYANKACFFSDFIAVGSIFSGFNGQYGQSR